MSVRIRLRRVGAKKRPYYRIVVADSRSPRDGRFIENVGNYQPIFKPATVSVKEDRIYEWLKKGAQPSTTVNSILRRIGLLYKWDLMKKGEDVSSITLKTELKEKEKLKGKAKKAAKAKAEAPPAEETPVVEEAPAAADEEKTEEQTDSE